MTAGQCTATSANILLHFSSCDTFAVLLICLHILLTLQSTSYIAVTTSVMYVVMCDDFCDRGVYSVFTVSVPQPASCSTSPPVTPSLSY
ncbi:hypothetical protein J6590_062314 [Homalodisca vitripennis]|nr:hypothetical protein J6590_062314 [Homalodisca vitripennis]